MASRVPLWCAAVILLASCRYKFDSTPDDAQAFGDAVADGEGIVPLWSTLLGDGTSGDNATSISRIFETPSGDLQIIGTSKLFGPTYADGWWGVLDGASGALQAGGVRTLDDRSQNQLRGATSTPTGLITVGSYYDPTRSEEPAIGEISFDGTWQRSLTLGGAGTTIGDNEALADVLPTADGGYVAVGYTRAGLGGCVGSCYGTDALIVKLAPDFSLQWSVIWGTSYGDERLERVLVLPTGDIIAGGGGYGGYDYSLGAGTQLDSMPSLLLRVTGSGVPVWASRLVANNTERASDIADLLYDPVSDDLLVAGFASFSDTVAVWKVGLDGVVNQVFEPYFDITKVGEITAMVPADDGGLFVAGFERVGGTFVTRTAYVAHVNAAHDAVTWAVRKDLGYSASRVGLIRARNGDLITWTEGSGTSGLATQVMRMRSDGTTPPCAGFTPAAMNINLVLYSTVTPPGSLTAATPSLGTIPTRSLDLPVSPAPGSNCPL